MPSLKAVTVCLWMKSSDTGNWRTPLHYAVPKVDEELVLFYYKNHVRVLREKLWQVGTLSRNCKSEDYLPRSREKQKTHKDVKCRDRGKKKGIAFYAKVNIEKYSLHFATVLLCNDNYHDDPH